MTIPCLQRSHEAVDDPGPHGLARQRKYEDERDHGEPCADAVAARSILQLQLLDSGETYRAALTPGAPVQQEKRTENQQDPDAVQQHQERPVALADAGRTRIVHDLALDERER